MTLPVVGNSLFDWEQVPLETEFVTGLGFHFKRLPCGHFRNEDAFDPGADGGERPNDFCWSGCHE